MAFNSLDSKTLKELFAGGLANLKANAARIDELNVFPIPDGDTGSNMLMTLKGALEAVANEDFETVGEFARRFSRGALLGARGNSGVILSQFIKGFSGGCEEKTVLSVPDFTEAFKKGVDKAYESVVKPTEGTMLTVMREGWEHISAQGANITNFNDYFDRLLRSMDVSLEHTPELLPVLKESGVIDSGGAGFICIFRGMENVISGEKVEAPLSFESGAMKPALDPSLFNADSELEFGYCTEFILQLQNKKTDIKNFDLGEMIAYLESVGNSIVAVCDDDLVKVHVHTFTPGEVLSFGQKYGEYITLKIENMQIQHNETSMFREEKKEEPPREHKAIAVVAVAAGTGIKSYFEELGADVIVDGGQTENPSTADFLKAFDELDADDIIVLPCNSNIVMAAEQAAELWSASKVHVVRAKTPAEAYSALSMMDLSDKNVSRVISEMEECIQGTKTGLITTAIRDVDYEKVSVKAGHYIGLNKDEILSDSENRLEAVKGLLNGTQGIKDNEVLVAFYGKNVPEEELGALEGILASEFGWMEYGFIDGGQDVYDYIFAIE